MHPQRLWQDARRVATGARRLAGYLASRDTADLGIGAFPAESGTVALGRAHRYAVRLASARPRLAAVLLRVDIAPVGAGGDEGHASFGRRVVIPPAATLTVALEYDWLDSAAFVIAGARLAP